MYFQTERKAFVCLPLKFISLTLETPECCALSYTDKQVSYVVDFDVMFEPFGESAMSLQEENKTKQTPIQLIEQGSMSVVV